MSCPIASVSPPYSLIARVYLFVVSRVKGPRDQFYQHKAVIKHPKKKVKPRQKRPVAEGDGEAEVEPSPCGPASPPLNQDTPPISDR